MNQYPQNMTLEEYLAWREDQERMGTQAELMRQEEQGGGVDPMQAYNIYSSYFAPEAGAAAGGETAAVAGGAEAGAGAAAGAEAGAGAGAGSGGAMAAAAPWVGLGAVIAANEYYGKKQGRRSEDSSEHMEDIVSGAVTFQDGEYIGDKIGGPVGDWLKDSNQIGERVVKALQPWEWF